ncbi:MAG TPA: sugar ABC transporter permease [Candidatus Methylomirabilis sp.]|nr:sugar ABC transporter permease [Candidatus Methylomirabilis sp.]
MVGTTRQRPVRRPGGILRNPTVMFLLPMVAYLILWRALPLLYTVYLSLNDWNLIKRGGMRFIGLENYVNLVWDARFHQSLWISFFFMVVATAIQTVLAVGLALATDRSFRGKSVVQGSLLLPMFLTPVAVGSIWYILFQPSIGPITYLSGLVGLPKINWLGSAGTALWGIVIADTWQWTPFIYLLVLSALQGIPETVIEAAQIDQASDLVIVWKIVLPLIKGTILVAALLRAMEAFRVFPKIYVMTGGGPGRATEAASILIYKTAFRFFEIGYASAMTIIMLVLLVAAYGFYLKGVRRLTVEY